MGSIITRDILPNYMNHEFLIIKVCAYIIKRYIRVITAIACIAFVYCFVNYFLKNHKYDLPTWLKDFNAKCFGMYIFQQFILQFLYYKSELPTIVGQYWLPWIGLSITLILSYLLTSICRKSRMGRLLM